MSTKGVCDMSCGAMHEFALVLDKAGFNADLIQEIVNSRGNKRAKAMYSALPNRVEVAKNTSILRLLIPNLTIPPTAGVRLLSEAKDIFPNWIDPDLTNYGCNVVGEPKPETLVDVHELIEDGTLGQMFEGQGVDLDKLCLTQDQIIQFVINHRQHLHPWGYATFFLFKKVAGQFFVADVDGLGARWLRVYVHRLASDCVWLADVRRRVVLPQLAFKS